MHREDAAPRHGRRGIDLDHRLMRRRRVRRDPARISARLIPRHPAARVRHDIDPFRQTAEVKAWSGLHAREYEPDRGYLQTPPDNSAETQRFGNPREVNVQQWCPGEQALGSSGSHA